MDALVLVDIQNDFLPGGALAVPQGDQVVPVANELMTRFELVVATQDWHPAGHGSFASQHAGRAVGDVVELGGLDQILWPDHCVQGTPGAELAPGLHASRIGRIIHKGIDHGIDSYSTFFDNGHQRATDLEPYLREHGVDSVYLLGLATDYCVKFSALDALQLGFAVYLVTDGCRGVDLNAGDVEAALREVAEAGAQLVESGEIAP